MSLPAIVLLTQGPGFLILRSRVQILFHAIRYPEFNSQEHSSTWYYNKQLIYFIWTYRWTRLVEYLQVILSLHKVWAISFTVIEKEFSRAFVFLIEYLFNL